MRRFVALLLTCSCVNLMNAQQQSPPQSEVLLQNVRRQNSNNPKKNGYDHVDSVQRLPSSDKTLANQVMTQLEQYTNMAGNEVDKERDLQIDPGTILDIVDTACDLVGTLMLLEGTAVCDCTLTLSLMFGCEFVTDVCTGNFCTTPDVQGAFDILQTRVTFTYCSNNATYENTNLPDFCVSVSGDLIPPDVSSSSSNEASVSEDRARIFGKGKRLRRVQFLDTITVTVNDQVCRSASICNKGQGYVFDCTNINALLKQSTCTPIQTITNLQQEPGSVVFLPQLDDPPPTKPAFNFTAFFTKFETLFKSLQNP